MLKRDPEGYYAALNISPDATAAEIRLSYSFISRTVMTSLDEDERAIGSAGIGAVRDAGAATGPVDGCAATVERAAAG